MKYLHEIALIAVVGTFPCFSQQAPPACIPAKLCQAYQDACHVKTKAARTVYLNTLASLQQECIARNDFAHAILLKKALEQAKNNPIVPESGSSWTSMIDVELKAASNWKQKITPEGKFIQMSPGEKEYRTTSDTVDTGKSMPDVIIFNSNLWRKWLLMEDGSVIQLFHCDTHVENLVPMSKGNSPQNPDINDKLVTAQKQYQISCAREIAPVTAKFITALEKIQKQALANEQLDDCIQIKQYIDALRKTSSGTGAASPSRLKGAWEDPSGTLYDINNSGTMIVRTQNGQIEQQGQYVRASFAGNYFFFKIIQGKAKGEERILFPYDGKIFLLKGDYSNWIRILKPRSK